MSTQLITDNFRVSQALSLSRRFSDERFFMFVGDIQSTESYPDVEDVENSISVVDYDSYRNMFFGRYISPQSVVPVIREITWQSGTVYEPYDDRTVSLSTKDFYVVVPEMGAYHIFKCLDNSGGTPSLVAPLRSMIQPDDEFFMTSDGYQWKFMYSIHDILYRQFAANGYIPVYSDMQVEENAVVGTLETIRVSNPGAQILGHARGTFTSVAVSGNTSIMSILSDVNTQMIDFEVSAINGGSLNSGESVLIKDGIDILTQAVVIGIYSSHLILSNNGVLIEPRAGLTVQSGSGVTTEVISGSWSYSNSLSNSPGFYNQSSIYLRAGDGAGQKRDIIEYIVTGNERRIVINQPFDVVPSLSTMWEISPKVEIRGDGQGAQAVSVVDPINNNIARIEIIHRGSDYSYADAFLVSNTGSSSTYVPAELRPIISPPGGHGSNVYSELIADAVEVSTTFKGADHPLENEYRTIGMLSEPRFRNVQLNLDSNSFNFLAGEIVESDSGVRGRVSSRLGNSLGLDNVQGEFVTGQTIKGASSGADAIILSTNRSTNSFDARTRISMLVMDDGPSGTGFVENEEVRQNSSGNMATGKVHSISTNLITLTDVRGVFMSSDDAQGVEETIVGVQSGAVGKVTGVVLPDIMPFSGSVSYLQNINPATRNIDQDDTVLIILKV